jgi:hypothetical protein
MAEPFDIDTWEEDDDLPEDEVFLIDMGLSPEGDRMTPFMRRADTGAFWSPDDADGHYLGERND